MGGRISGAAGRISDMGGRISDAERQRDRREMIACDDVVVAQELLRHCGCVLVRYTRSSVKW